jgi:type I restriction enzyme S subunit
MMQGMMQQLLTGQTRLPGFTAPWSDAPLGTVAIVNMGQSPPGSSYNTSGRGVPLVQGNADIKHRRTIDRLRTTQPTKHCRTGDVILTVRAPVGFTAVAAHDSCIGRGVCSLAAGPDNRFMFHALMYAEPRWAVYEQGSTFTAVNSNEVRAFSIPWPRDPEERRAVAWILDDADAAGDLLKRRLTKARAIKQGMMQQLLTGRTRLPVREVAA